MLKYQTAVLAVANQKGGVGKTTLSSIIAEYASIIRGKRVLIVDLDLQCNSSDYWIGMESAPNAVGGQLPPKHPLYEPGDEDMEERSSIADIFFGKEVFPHRTYICQHGEEQSEDHDIPENAKFYEGRVDVLVGHPELLESINTLHDNKSNQIEENIINVLGTFLHLDGVRDEYDLVIVDTGPSRNPLFRAAVRAATHIVIPFEPEEKSLQGINAMIHIHSQENYSRMDTELQLIGLCPNKVRPNTRMHRDTLERLQQDLAGTVFPDDTYLPHSTVFPERDAAGANPKSIFEIPESHKARQKADLVAGYIYDNIFG